jgi:hypothetical protein
MVIKKIREEHKLGALSLGVPLTAAEEMLSGMVV